MDLRSGQPFWPIKNGLLGNYPKLTENLVLDVAVLGAGVTGALCAYRLARAGLRVAVIDARDVARGSTSASTALLQYEIDTHLVDLAELIGLEDAERAYQLCRDAIYQLEALTQELGDPCGFERKPSLYFASSDADASSLEAEYEARGRAGFELELWDRPTLAARFGFSAPNALYSQDGAQVDSYCLTHRLLMCARELGARVFDRTTAERLEASGSGVAVTTDGGFQVAARHLVFATGYESQRYLKEKVVTLKSTYALASEPLTAFEGWHERALLWESARPYFYARTTDDGRAIIGGEDIPFRNPQARDALLAAKTARLEARFRALFPNIPLETAYAWTGTFGETKDGLAYIGPSPEFPSCFFALGYGGNGITYSVLAAGMLRDLILGRPTPDARLFRFGR